MDEVRERERDPNQERKASPALRKLLHTAAAVALAWNMLGALTAQAQEPPAEPNPIILDLPPDVNASAEEGAFIDHSAFALGTAAVGIVVVDGPHQEWTAAERNKAISEVMQGTAWWSRRIAESGNGGYLHYVFDLADARSPDYEPTEQYAHHVSWLAQAMNSLGMPQTDFFEQISMYNESLQAEYGTDWAFTIFVVKGKMLLPYYGQVTLAYTKNSEYVVLTNEVGGAQHYGPDNLDAVTAHEVGHIWGLLDGYWGSGSWCDDRGGYLHMPNENFEAPTCPLNVPSIMRNMVITMYRQNTYASVDPASYHLAGLVDANNNQRWDVLETTIPITAALTLNGNQVTLAGAASEVPYPSPSMMPQTINRLQSMEYALDGKPPWRVGQRFSGTKKQEQLALTVPDIPPGYHTLNIRVLDNWGVQGAYASPYFAVLDPADGGLSTDITQTRPGAVGEWTVAGWSYDMTNNQTIARVQVRFNNQGEWQIAQPQDGQFNSPSERWSVQLTRGNWPQYIIACAVTAGGTTEQNCAQALTVQVALPVIRK